MAGFVAATVASQSERLLFARNAEQSFIANQNLLSQNQRNTASNAPRGAISVLDSPAVSASNQSSTQLQEEPTPLEQARQSNATEETQEGAPSGNLEAAELTDEEQAQVRELQARDREVRAHEQAHALAGGPYASAPTYEFQTGPDGQQYAVAGEVQIDSAPIEGDPSASIEKLRTVIRAALAPREPSPQDRAVARQAQADLQEAQQQLREEQQAELQGGEEEGSLSAFNLNNEEAERAANIYQSVDNIFSAATLFGSGGVLA